MSPYDNSQRFKRLSTYLGTHTNFIKSELKTHEKSSRQMRTSKFSSMMISPLFIDGLSYELFRVERWKMSDLKIVGNWLNNNVTFLQIHAKFEPTVAPRKRLFNQRPFPAIFSQLIFLLNCTFRASTDQQSQRLSFWSHLQRSKANYKGRKTI